MGNAKIEDCQIMIQSSDIALKTITSRYNLSPEMQVQTVKFYKLDNNGDLAWINSGTADIGDGDLTPAQDE